MADTDYDSQLPVRSKADGVDERVQSKLVGAASATLGAAAAYQMQVDADGNAHAEVHGHKSGGTTDVVLELSDKGAVVPDGVYHVSDNVNPGNIGLVGMGRDASPADAQQTLRITAKANTDGTPGEVRALDIALHDEAGNAYSPTNPIPVAISETEAGTPVHDEKTQLALAKDTPANYDYEVPSGKTLYLKQVLCAASGKSRFEVQIGDGAVSETFTKKAVRFGTASAPNPDVAFSQPIVVVGTADGTNVRIVFENKDNGVQDLSATIVGTLVNT